MIKIGGFLKQQPVIVLVDTESTNNFMCNKLLPTLDSDWANTSIDLINGLPRSQRKVLQTMKINLVVTYARKKRPLDKLQNGIKFEDRVLLHL
ncbi:hypothetical protein GW17_00033141 [Ensete ventricosum]|nr:hypothetical protein GW17_00033141 [Ensete ventricosum]RZR88828.1 hypothetical protein BHM03_00016464 [Ensete ventricosum]